MPILRKQATLTLAFAAALAGQARSAEPTAPKSGAEKVLESILAKEGISIGGAFRSQYLHSSIGGPGAIPTLRSEESVEFTSVDFDIRARPNTATQGRLIIRMHQDWRNFFSDIGNPINTRWISIDGKVAGMFSYSVGDFHRKYSPLTLWAHSPELLYEPDLFAGSRREAMSEAFLDGNKRLMQGVDLAFDAALDQDGKAILSEAHVDFLGTRLRNVETNIQNGGKVTNWTEASPVEKFMTAGNFDLVSPLGPSLGGTVMAIFDKKATAGYSMADTGGQNTRVFSGRAGFDLGSLLKSEDWGLKLNLEYAMSSDDTDFIAKLPDTISHLKIEGSALLARLEGSWKAGETFGLKAGVNYLKNEADFRNELAQSPTFIGERILNIENDTSRVRTNDVRARNYSTFDALYRNVFKFVPSVNTNMWVRAPFQKNSWNNHVLTQNEMAAFAALRTDTALQLVMPFGPATANRTGVQADLTLGALSDKIEIKASYSALENVTGPKIDTVRSLPITKFTQMGGGLKVEAGGLIGLSLPLTLSGSLVRSTADNAGLAGDTIHVSKKVTSDLINGGAMWNFWKKFSVLGGWQQIKTKVERPARLSERVQTHVAGGLDYKVSAGAHLLATLGQVKVDEPAPAVGGIDKDFDQLQTELFLTVHF